MNESTASVLADELLSSLQFDRVTVWTPDGLGVDSKLFTSIAATLLEREIEGKIEILSIGRGTRQGEPYLRLVKFVRLDPD